MTTTPKPKAHIIDLGAALAADDARSKPIAGREAPKPCGMVIGWKSVSVLNAAGETVDVDRGDEIECGKPSAWRFGDDGDICQGCFEALDSDLQADYARIGSYCQPAAGEVEPVAQTLPRGVEVCPDCGREQAGGALHWGDRRGRLCGKAISGIAAHVTLECAQLTITRLRSRLEAAEAQIRSLEKVGRVAWDGGWVSGYALGCSEGAEAAYNYDTCGRHTNPYVAEAKRNQPAKSDG